MVGVAHVGLGQRGRRLVSTHFFTIVAAVTGVGSVDVLRERRALWVSYNPGRDDPRRAAAVRTSPCERRLL